jgi:hypothetical protein
MPTMSLVAPAQNAAVEQAQIAAEVARAQAQAAADVAREQAQASRDQAQDIRDAVRAARDGAQGRHQIGMPIMPPPFQDRAAKRQQGLFFVGFVVVVMATVAVLYPIMRAIGRRIEGAPRREAVGGANTERLERIEQAVEAMAVEIERISEGQRFTTKLLAGRADAESVGVRRV